MAKKITREMVKEVLTPVKKHIFTAKDGQEFVVAIKQDITAIGKQRMMESMLAMVEEKGEEYIPILTIIGLLQAVTDIEFGDTMDEKIETLYWLEDIGLSDPLAAAIPDKVVAVIDAYMQDVLKLTKELGSVEDGKK